MAQARVTAVAALMLATLVPFGVCPPAPPGSPVAVNGRLRVDGCHIVNEAGEPVQLRGVCTHGLQWHGDFYRSGKAIDAAATEWGADVVRLTVYVYEGGYLDNERLTTDDFDALIDVIVRRCVAEEKEIRWADIVAYANEVIPAIRQHAPEAIVLVGTPDWCFFGMNLGRDWRVVVDHPLEQPNVVYVVHF